MIIFNIKINKKLSKYGKIIYFEILFRKNLEDSLILIKKKFIFIRVKFIFYQSTVKMKIWKE